MNQKTTDLFKAWLLLNEDEKRDFIKKILSYNNMTPSEKKAVERNLDK